MLSSTSSPTLPLATSIFTSLASLIKIRITLSVTLIAAIGWYVAGRGLGNLVDFSIMLGLTAMVCAGVCVLNHVMEWKSDAQMKRTAARPIPSGRIGWYPALILGTLLTLMGLYAMMVWINFGMSLGAAITGALYLLVYTPLKKISWFNTTVGAIPGALPIMGGWYAYRGEMGLEGWVLLLILFFWQHPHFYAIAWLCKDDYRNAGYKMIADNDESGAKTFGSSFIYMVLLALGTLLLLVTDFDANLFYLLAVVVLNVWFGYSIWQTLRSPVADRKEKNRLAQKVVQVSVWYQVLYFVAIIVDNLFRVTII